MPNSRNERQLVKETSKAKHCHSSGCRIFFSSLIIIYCMSGIALNHVNDWNPDFIIQKKTIEIKEKYSLTELTPEVINGFGKLVGEDKFKVYDTPTSNRAKIYYENASLLIDAIGCRPSCRT